MFNRLVRVLVVSVDSYLHQFVQQTLASQEYQCEIVSSFDDATYALLGSTSPHDIIIVGLPSPADEALNFISRVKDTPRTSLVPIILVVEKASDITIATALSRGASDFVTTPLDVDGFALRLATHLRTRDTLRQLEQQNRLLSKLAAYDDLTGLYNRRSFVANLDLELENVQKEEHQGLALFLLDLDRFKKINDTYGHLAGDTVIQRFGKLIHSCLRPADVVGRFGGDEFCMLTTGSSYEQILALAERLTECIEAQQYSLGHNISSLSITASIGVAFIHSGQVASSTLIAQADKALYEAKMRGRNCWVVHQLESELATHGCSDRTL